MESHLIPACTSRARALVCECILYGACPVFICIHCSFLLALMASGLHLKQVRTRIKPTSSQLPSLKFVCQCLCSLSPFWSQSLLGCIKLILHVISKCWMVRERNWLWRGWACQLCSGRDRAADRHFPKKVPLCGAAKCQAETSVRGAAETCMSLHNVLSRWSRAWCRQVWERLPVVTASLLVSTAQRVSVQESQMYIQDKNSKDFANKICIPFHQPVNPLLCQHKEPALHSFLQGFLHQSPLGWRESILENHPWTSSSWKRDTPGMAYLTVLSVLLA